jgi:GTPase SAR1 family protein
MWSRALCYITYVYLLNKCPAGEFSLQGMQVTVLEELDLSNNELTHVDRQLFDPAVAPKLRSFNGLENRLRQPPQQLVNTCWTHHDTKMQLKGVQRRQWYTARVKAKHSLVKLAVVGKENVGKTVLIYRLMRRDEEAQGHLQSRQPTRGVHHDCWEHPLGSADATQREKLEFIVWDYAGQHEYRGTHQCLFTRQALYLVVLDLNEDEGESAKCAKQWICDIEDRVAGAVFALVGTKADLVPSEEAQRKYRRVLSEVHLYLEQRKQWERTGSTDGAMVIPASVEEGPCTWIVGCTDTFMLNGYIDKLREAIVNDVIRRHSKRFPHLFEERPVAWLRVLNVMLDLRRSSVSSIFVETEAIREKAKVTDEELKTGLRFWHEVGMCLWYESSAALREYVLHDPEQVSKLLRALVDAELAEDGISQLSDEAAKCLQLGQLTVQITHALWAELFSAQSPRLSEECFGQLVLSLLEWLDLVVESCPAAGTYFVPLLLPTCPQVAWDIIRRPPVTRRVADCGTRPVYMLRVVLLEMGRRDTAPYGLFERLIARLYRAKIEMLGEHEVSSSPEAPAWEMYRDCLTDTKWFALFVRYTPQCEIALRIDCRADTRTFSPESRCFAKRVWNTLCNVAPESFRGVWLRASIVLEDWTRKTRQLDDLEFSLNDITQPWGGCVKDPEQMLGETAARELWPQSKENHPLLTHVPTEPLELSKLKLGEILGRGGFGLVYRASYDGLCVAAKQLTPLNDKESLMVRREIESHSKYPYRTLLKMYGACESEDGVHVYLVLEYALYGSLKAVCFKTRVTAHDCKNSMGVDVSLERRVQWLKDVIEAVSHLSQEQRTSSRHKVRECPATQGHESLVGRSGTVEGVVF